MNRSRQKFALLFLAGTVFFCCALLFSAHCAARSAAQKGAPPPFIPCKLFEKSLTKNFPVLFALPHLGVAGRSSHRHARLPRGPITAIWHGASAVSPRTNGHLIVSPAPRGTS